jgi:hypothetical protein
VVLPSLRLKRLEFQRGLMVVSAATDPCLALSLNARRLSCTETPVPNYISALIPSCRPNEPTNHSQSLRKGSYAVVAGIGGSASLSPFTRLLQQAPVPVSQP